MDVTATINNTGLGFSFRRLFLLPQRENFILEGFVLKHFELFWCLIIEEESQGSEFVCFACRGLRQQHLAQNPKPHAPDPRLRAPEPGAGSKVCRVHWLEGS